MVVGLPLESVVVIFDTSSVIVVVHIFVFPSLIVVVTYFVTIVFIWSSSLIVV